MTKPEIRRHLRGYIRDAVRVIGGSGGRMECQYCLKSSYPKQRQHYNADGHEAYEPCLVTVMQAALKELKMTNKVAAEGLVSSPARPQLQALIAKWRSEGFDSAQYANELARALAEGAVSAAPQTHSLSCPANGQNLDGYRCECGEVSAAPLAGEKTPCPK